MISAKAQKVFTVQEYLDWEKSQDERFEFHDGMIVSMAGGTPPHALICENIFGNLYSLLKKTECRPRGTEQKVHVEKFGNFAGNDYYPDITIVCGKSQYNAWGCLLNPVLIGEVLSPSTHLFDRNDKFECYRTLPSLKTYLLIAQNTPRIEVFRRDLDGDWNLEPTEIIETLDGVLELRDLGVTLKMTDIYVDVFPHFNP